MFEERVIRKRISQLKIESEYLTKIRKITNECLSNGAYSESNMEMQFKMFEEKNVPEWETDIIQKAWHIKKQMAHKLLRKLDILLDDMEKETDGKKGT